MKQAGESSSVIVARPGVGVVVVGLGTAEGGDVAAGLLGGRLTLEDDPLCLLLPHAQCGRGHRGRGLGERVAVVGGVIVGGRGNLDEGPFLALPGHLPVEATEMARGRLRRRHEVLQGLGIR